MASPVEIFCCYARKDQPLLNELKAHLMPLQRQWLITLWADTDIGAGAEWEKEIEKHLDTAQIILLLISPAFMNSDYCYSKEMQRAIDRHERGEARVIPVVLRSVLWQEEPLNKLQLDEAFLDVVKGIQKAVKELIDSREQLSPVRPIQSLVVANEKPKKRSKTTILVADDDPQTLRLVARNLQLEGYDVFTASDGKQALELIEQHALDLVLLDVMMPKMDGFTLCHRVREFSSVPIIMATSLGRDQDIVRGLDLGADDYLTKPFSVEQLIARVRAVLRRAQFTASEQTRSMRTTATVGDLTIDYAQHLVTMAGREVPLTPIEYRLLAYLAQNVGRVVTQDLLLEDVWGSEYIGEGHMLYVSIKRLRLKLEPDPNHPRYILSKVGIGYLLSAQPMSG